MKTKNSNGNRIELFLGQIGDLREDGYTFKQIAELLSETFHEEITDAQVMRLLGDCAERRKHEGKLDQLMTRIDEIESSMGIIAGRVAAVAELGDLEGRLKELVDRLTGLPEVIQIAHDGSHLTRHIVAIEAHAANIDVWLRKISKGVAA